MKNKRNTILENKKVGDIPRCWWSKAKKKRSAKVLIKCGDCDNKLEIYYDKEKSKNSVDQAINELIEINGILVDKKWWKELFKEIGIIE
jgi:hypothetical protein